jgi:hypothetical protein
MVEETYSHLLEKLRAAYRRMQVRELLQGVSKFLVVVLAAVIAVSAVEAVGRFATVGRLMLLMMLGLVSMAALIKFLVLPLLQKSFDPDAVAKVVGEAFPSLKDRLVNALQVYHESAGNPFAAAALKRVEKEAAPFNFEQAISLDKAKKTGGVAATSVMVAALLFALSPLGLNKALVRIVKFNEDFTPPPPFKIISLSKDIEIAKGGDAELRFRVVENPESETPLEVRRLTLKLIDENGFEWQELKLVQDSTGEFAYQLKNQKQPLVYFAESDVAGKIISSEKHRLTVLDKPRLEMFQLALVPPAYSRLSVQQLEPNFGDAVALKGSKVSLRLKASKPIQAATLIANDTLLMPMQVSGDSALLTFVLKDDIAYQLEAYDRAQMRTEKSAIYHIRVLPDEYPTIRILQPETKETTLPESLIQPLTIELKDDFGFSKLSLKFRVTKSEVGEPEQEFRELPISLSGEGSQIDKIVNFTWNLNKVGVVAGDELEFYAEVHDNDAVSGYKAARTDFYRFRLPSLEEVFAQVEQAEKNATEALEKKIEEAKSIQEQLEKVQNELRQKNRSNWQDRKVLEQALKKQEELQKSAAAISDELQKMMQQMQERQLVSEETLQKYQEVQRLMDEINSPELKEAMRQLQEALAQVNDQQLRQALEKMTFNEEQLRKSLERTKELLQRIQLERKIDELARRMNEMIRKQEELRAETMQQSKKNSEKFKELQKEQDRLEKDLKEFEQARQELESKMKNFPKQEQLPMEELEKLRAQAEQDELEKDVSEAEEKLREQNAEAAAEKQQSALQKMKQRQKQIAEMKQELSRQRRQELLEAMQNAARSALELSKEQEALKKETEQIRNQASFEQSREIAQNQQQILESLKQLQESISKIGKKSSKIRAEMSRQLARAEEQMEQSIASMEARNAPQAAQNMKEAMHMLNEFAQQTSEMLAQMMGQQGKDGQGESGDSLSELMQGLSDQQSELNGETQSLMQGRNQADRAQRLAQLAAQQRLIQEQLKQLAQRQAQRQNEGKGNELMGNLEKLAEEMEEAAKSLEQQDLSRELVKRQQQILSRMLQSTKSLQRREFEEQREAKTAKNFVRKSPAEIESQTGRSKIQDALNRLREKGYSDDYQKLIRRYYDALEKLQSN